MALINCKECGKEVSDQAASCPHCGAPIRVPVLSKVTAKPNGCNGCLAVLGVFIGLVIVTSVIGGLVNGGKKVSEVPKKSLNLDGHEAGSELVYGRSGCRRTLKQLLRDPESLQGDQYIVTEASPGKWTAQIQFRSRNGFGGLNSMQAVCSFDGSNYQVQIISDQ